MAIFGAEVRDFLNFTVPTLNRVYEHQNQLQLHAAESLLKILRVTQLVKKYPAFYVT
jgi:hypothetical protein